MPFRTHAPMKLPYEVATARQTLAARHTTDEAMRTGLRPKVTARGTLFEPCLSGAILWVGRGGNLYQMKLLKPRTRMQTPVNWTTSGNVAWNAAMRSPNMGARASGPMPMMKVVAMPRKMALNFQ